MLEVKLTNKTKAELVEIIKQKENEIIDLKNDLRVLEKCERYDDITDEIRSVFSKLIDKGFKSNEALELVQTMIASGEIRSQPMRRSFVSYR